MTSAITIPLSKATLADKTIYELEDDYKDNIVKLFDYNSDQVKIVKIGLDLFLRAKDILKMLGYDDNLITMKAFIRQKIPKEFKKTLKEILELIPADNEMSMAQTTYDHNDLNDVYLTENGFYRTVIRSNKPKGLEFQIFVYNTLSYLRNNALARAKTKLGQVENQMQKDREEFKTRHQELMDKHDETLQQNKLLLKKLEESNQKLDITNEMAEDLKFNNLILQDDMSDMKGALAENQETLNDVNKKLKHVNKKLDIVIEDRNIAPKNKSKAHYYILLRSKSDPKEFSFRAGQASHIKGYEKLQKYDISRKDKNPNPVDLRVRFKEEMERLNKLQFQKKFSEYHETDEYKNSRDKEGLRQKFSDSISYVIFHAHTFRLNTITEAQLLQFIDKLIDVKYKVDAKNN